MDLCHFRGNERPLMANVNINDSILGEVRNPSPYLAEMGLRIPETYIGD